MNKHVLLKSQKNLVFQCIQNFHFDPANFEWYDQEISGRFRAESRISPAIRHKDTGFFFCFDALGDDHKCIFSPGTESTQEQISVLGWDEQFHYFQRWLQYMQREVEQPDLWDQFTQNSLANNMKVGTDEDNRPFTRSEIKSLTKSIEGIRTYMLENGAETEKQILLANSRLDFLIQEVKHRGRRDWFFLAVGLLLTTCTELALSPEKMRTVLDLFKIGISGVVHLLGLP